MQKDTVRHTHHAPRFASTTGLRLSATEDAPLNGVQTLCTDTPPASVDAMRDFWLGTAIGGSHTLSYAMRTPQGTTCLTNNLAIEAIVAKFTTNIYYAAYESPDKIDVDLSATSHAPAGYTLLLNNSICATGQPPWQVAVSNLAAGVHTLTVHSETFPDLADEAALTIVNVDLDVDADYNGVINEADEPLEENPGGLVCVCTNNLTRINLKLEPANLPGKLTLSVTGGDRIKVWSDNTLTNQVTLPKTWNAGATVPGTLYIVGVNASTAVCDVTLRLEYEENAAGHNNHLFKCADVIWLTVINVDLAIGSVSDADEESVGGFVPVNADNDNGSTVTDHIPATRDFDTNGYTDDDLVSLSLSLEPTTGLSGTLRLRKVEGGRDRIKVWETTGKATEVTLPKTWTVGTDTIATTLQVEGLKEGEALRDVDLVLEYLESGAMVCDDTVKVTVTPVLKMLQATGSGSPWFNSGQSLLVSGTGSGISLSGETYQNGLPSGVLSLIQHMKYDNHLADGAGTITYNATKKKADHTDTAYRGMALVDVPLSIAMPWYVLAAGGTPWEFSAADNPMLAIVTPQTIELIDNDPTSKTLVDP